MPGEVGGSGIPLAGRGSVGFWKQTKLLISKNWKCKLRSSKKKLAGEILVPVFYLVLLSFLVKIQPITDYPEQTTPKSKAIDVIAPFQTLTTFKIVNIAPNTTETRNVCKTIINLASPAPFKCQFHETFEDLERAYSENETENSLGVVFFSTTSNFNYTIITNPNGLPPLSQKTIGLDTCRGQIYSEELEFPATCPVNGYHYSGFLGLQYLINQAYLEIHSKGPSLPAIKLQNYPQNIFLGGMSTYMRAIIPLYSVIPMAQLINSLLVLIVTEKEERIKDGFRMIGVSDAAYWISWFSVYSGIIGILSVLFTLVMHFTNILKNINIILLFLIFFAFGLSVISFAFALTPFFHKPKTAGVVGTLIMQSFGMLFMVQTFVKGATDAYLVPLRLISSLAFTTALDEACAYEYNGGISFGDLTPNGRGARILYSLIFLCFDTVLYGIIALYLDNVIPNEYGARKHPLFFLNLFSRRTSVGYRRGSFISMPATDGRPLEDGNIESVPPSMANSPAISIRKIFKTYTSLFSSTKVEAVKGISLDIYNGQITAILGKNGAGKSTLFSIITGLVPPTKGKCHVFGLDTSEPLDMDRLRQVTGVCLQTNQLFAPLTVEEHLQLYGELRGLEGDALKTEIDTILADLKLTEKAKVTSDKLSGGQQRKLSVGIALIGDPALILLDEPSAGVDPVSRRHLWALLKRKKEGRVILLATHFLDEADFLADRKAIIHDGVLKCCGSSLFLKNRFGVGYHLTVEVERNAPIDKCDEIIDRFLPDSVESRKIIGKELKYCLPNNQVHVFPELFRDIEKLIESSNQAFKSYGVSMTTLEEVFLKISNDAWLDSKLNTEEASIEVNSNCDDECNLVPELNEISINIPESLWVLSLLRIRRLVRSLQSLFFLTVMPLLLVAGGLGLMKTQSINAVTQLSLNHPRDMYPDQRRVAHSPSKSSLDTFLKSTGFTVESYSGDFSDLLRPVLADPGTMAALETGEGSVVNLFVNGTFLHSPPLIVNALSQYYASKFVENGSISANVKTFDSAKTPFDPSTLYAMFLIAPSFTLIAIGLVMELVKDREINTRNHLRVNGVSFVLYFSSSLLVFGFLAVLLTFAQVGLLYAFALPAFTNPYALTVATILLLLFILPCLLFSTWFSYFFNKLESAQSIFSPICSWMGIIVGVVVMVLDSIYGATNPNTVLIIHGVSCALDIFYIPFAIFYWINKQYLICSVTDSCDGLSFSQYSGPEFVIMGTCMVVQVPVYLLLIVVADVVKNGGNPWSAVVSIFKRQDSVSRKVRDSIDREISNENECTPALDDDVALEKKRISNILCGQGSPSENVVLLHNLKKTYQKRRPSRKGGSEGFVALKGLDLGVERGEVFGLLGHNGAGKTTTMRIITAEESPDSGIVRLCGVDIDSNYSEAFSKLGYCAQHDPLWENITVREHLELYATVRGIPREKRDRLINQFLRGLQIEEHSNKKAAKLSGGTKRKLCYGISMLGSPRVVLMDEPSTGMDPQSKRFLWNTILGSFKEERGAILTTHSMEEAEILCSRIAILAKGRLICIGSPQHLKSKYGSGYTLEIKLKSDSGESPEDASDRYQFVKDHFPDCTLTEAFDEKAVFSLNTASVSSISHTFALLEQLKVKHNIEEYSFSQTTLEQIFLQFAKEEDDEDDA